MSVPDRIDELEQFCEKKNISEAHTALSLLFRDPPENPIPNLVRLIQDPALKSVIECWSSAPHIGLFSNYASITAQWFNDNRIDVVVPAGNAERLRRDFRPLKTQFYLPAMLVANTDSQDHEYSWLRKHFKLWLFFEAAHRLADGNLADQNLSEVCRFLVADLHDRPRWEFLDHFLKRYWEICNRHTQPWRMTRIAMERTADQLSAVASNRANASFLRAVRSIASGVTTPISLTNYDRSIFAGGFLRNHVHRHSDFPEVELSLDDDDKLVGRIYPQEPEEDETEQAIVLEVDGYQTPAQQRHRSSGFVFHSVEKASYLPWTLSGVLPPNKSDLTHWIQRKLVSSDERERIGAAVVEIALMLGRSISVAAKLAITDQPGEEWSISTCFEFVSRKPPQRQNAWEARGEVEADWIEPFASQLSVKLPKQVRDTLYRLAEAQTEMPDNLESLWRRAQFGTDQLIDVWFRSEMKAASIQIGSSNLNADLGNSIMERTEDHNLAALLESPPNAGLPAACGYSTWTIENVENGFNSRVETSHENQAGLIGSRLAPIEEKLRDEIAVATRKVTDACLANNAVEHHNQLTQYCVLALYAGTGCRHLVDPFECPSVFNRSKRFVYINDKQYSATSGRIVPLPDNLLKLLDHFVTTHLPLLAEKIRPFETVLSKRIEQLVWLWTESDSQGPSAASIPLFFNLDHGLQWHHASDHDVPGLPLVGWPLPENLFRHRYAQKLQREDIRPDVIDGWMGHAGFALSPYGDHSPRTMLEDINSYRDSINQVYDQLGFVETFESHKSPLAVSVGGPGCRKAEKPFGERARTIERGQRNFKEMRKARSDINSALLDVAPQDLTQQHLDQILDTMLFREDGRLHHSAALRVKTLETSIREWNMEGELLIRRRAVTSFSGGSPLDRTAPKAVEVLSKLQTFSCTRLRSVYTATASKKCLLMVAVTKLCLEKRISYRRMLRDIAQGKSYRIVQKDRTCYIEYSEALDPDDWSAPIQRHQISHALARILEAGMGYSRGGSVLKSDIDPILKPLLSFTGAEQKAFGQVLDRMAAIVEQANLIELPGNVAATLSERIPSSSLPLLDWQRLTRGHRLIEPDSDSTDLDIPLSRPSMRREQCDDNTTSNRPCTKKSLDSARRLLEQVNRILIKSRKSNSKQTADTIEKVCEKYADRTSTTVRILGHWIVHTMRKGKGAPGRRFSPFAPSSIRRYLSALSRTFSEVAHNVDIFALDQNGMTDLCEAILRETTARKNRLNYVVERLVKLTSYAADLGAAMPDWGELDIPIENRSVRPGAISIDDYHQAFELLRNQENESGESHLSAQRALYARWILFLSFRFGLRANEAMFLEARDWNEQQSWRWVLVRRNVNRDLKSLASRRALPQVEPLEDFERDLIERVISEHQGRTGDKRRSPIISESATLTPDLFIDVATALRRVTGNPRLVTHHLRHSYYNRISSALLGVQTESTQALVRGAGDPDKLRQIVLGSHCAPCSRSLTAMARLMGHKHPSTGLMSYSHWLTEWADQLTPCSEGRHTKLKRAFRVDEWSKHPSLDLLAVGDVHRKPDRVSIAKMLRLVAMGQSFQQAGTGLNFSRHDIGRIAETVSGASHGMRFHNSGTGWFYGADKTLVERISPNCWERLIAAFEATKTLSHPTLGDADISALIGHFGEVRLVDPYEFEFLAEVISNYQLQDYCVLRRIGASEVIDQRASQSGLTALVTTPGSKRQISRYRRKHEGVEYVVNDFSAVIFNQNSHAVVRNSLEFALLVVVMALERALE